MQTACRYLFVKKQKSVPNLNSFGTFLTNQGFLMFSEITYYSSMRWCRNLDWPAQRPATTPSGNRYVVIFYFYLLLNSLQMTNFLNAEILCHFDALSYKLYLLMYTRIIGRSCRLHTVSIGLFVSSVSTWSFKSHKGLIASFNNI